MIATKQTLCCRAINIKINIKIKRSLSYRNHVHVVRAYDQPQSQNQEPIAHINIIKEQTQGTTKVPFGVLSAPDVGVDDKDKDRGEESYTDFINDVKRKRVVSVDMRPDATLLTSYTVDGKQFTVNLPISTAEIGTVDILAFLEKAGVNVTIKPEVVDPNYFGMIMRNIFPITFLAYVTYVVIQGMGKGGGGGMGMFMNKDFDLKIDTGVTFDEVAGAEIAKTELMEVVDFLKNPGKYDALGAQVPKGVLLYGSPGVGKTLLARAVAGEAGVPFFACSGSDFIELFVGVGAGRVRNLFQKAKEKAPCIIFIDEIDTIGKQRGGGGGFGGNDEREQTINQLLTLMDGFEGNTGVIVIAATNRPDVLDAALLRPGRFDRRILVDLADVKGRTAILGIHTRGKPIADDVNLRSIAKNTVGFSGADLQSLCNEAAIYAARENASRITSDHFEAALEKLTLGEARRSILVTEDKKRIVSYHEAGHALMGLLVNDYEVVRKVSIVPRGSAAGVTYFEPREENLDISLVSQEYLMNRIMVALGGRVAEELIFGPSKITTGASGDLQEVQRIARDMVSLYGFNESLGAANWANVPGSDEDTYNETRAIVESRYNLTYSLLEKNIKYLHKIADALMEKEVLTNVDLQHICSGLKSDLE